MLRARLLSCVLLTDSPYFDDCAVFCEKWDQSSFDPEYRTLPLEFFAPMVREVFARKSYDSNVIMKGHRAPLENAVVAATRANS